MTVYEAIEIELKASSGVTNIVGNRIYHGKRPRSTTNIPCINFHLVSNPIASERRVVETPLYQISNWGKNIEQAMELSMRVEEVFQSIRSGILQGGVITNTIVMAEPESGCYHAPVDVRFTVVAAENV